MCHDIILLTDIESIDPPLPVFLPDGGTHFIHKMGKVTLPGNLFLSHVLYLPTFKLNLLSVHHLSTSTNVCFSFSPSICCLQNLKTKKVLVVGKVLGALYILDLSSFHHIPTSLVKTNMPSASSSCNAFTSLNKSDH